MRQITLLAMTTMIPMQRKMKRNFGILTATMARRRKRKR
jgi:hypothetical protein